MHSNQYKYYSRKHIIIIVLYCIVLYCIMRPYYTESRCDRYRIGNRAKYKSTEFITRELSEIRTQPWLSERSLT